MHGKTKTLICKFIKSKFTSPFFSTTGSLWTKKTKKKNPKKEVETTDMNWKIIII